MRYRYPEADRTLEKAVAIAPQRAEALAESGRRAQEYGHYETATRYFERASKESGASANVFVTLAELYERGHRHEDSVAQVTHALRLQGEHPGARLVQARLKRLEGAIEEAERLVRGLLESPSCDPQTKIRGWYELGTILDRQSRFDEAMAAFLEAKALQRPMAVKAGAILQSIQARVREEEQTITAKVLERWAAATELAPARPLAVLCGHPRSGTTLLEQVLDSHPQIVSAEETHILHDEAYLPLSRGFDPSTSVLQVLDAAPPSQLRLSRENYFRFTELFIGKSLAGKLLVDKNPALNVLIPAVVRIFPEAKFLVALRDPRDVCLSCFMQPLAMNPVSSAYLTLEGTVAQYASVMGFWRTLLPRMRNSHLEVRYEDVVTNLEGEARRVLGFLEVPWHEGVLRYHEHAKNKPVRSPSYAEVTRPVFKTAIGRWKNYQKYLEPWVAKLGPFLDQYRYN
jgi:tetratricopeptide (TPR) repeat protein